MTQKISYAREDDTMEAKARWFQSLSLSERMDMLCLFTDFILASRPNIAELKNAQPASGRVCIISQVWS
ncbi:MAG TPA: hypothetical protein VGD14_23905 [bacterium]